MHDPHVLQTSERFRSLVAAARLSMATAMTLYNRGRQQPVRESGWKSWLAEPDDPKWVPVSEAELAHAERVFAHLGVERVEETAPEAS